MTYLEKLKLLLDGGKRAEAGSVSFVSSQGMHDGPLVIQPIVEEEARITNIYSTDITAKTYAKLSPAPADDFLAACRRFWPGAELMPPGSRPPEAEAFERELRELQCANASAYARAHREY